MTNLVEHTILVVDDEDFVRQSIADLLESEGYRVLTASGPPAGLALLQREVVDAIISDLSMPDGTGIDLLTSVRKQDAHVPVILLTGVGTVRDAVAAMKLGASDFIQKPIDPEQLFLLVERAVREIGLQRELERLRQAVSELRKPVEMVGVSPWFARLKQMIPKVAASDVTVLVTGESGTGKELVAAEIHRASPRAAGQLVKLNCAVVGEGAFARELFGEREGTAEGGFTERLGRLAEAEGGTLLLDEVGALSAALQAKLLEVLESGQYQALGDTRIRRASVRVIAITNEILEERVEEGSFRADLFYRLNGFPIKVPPLRERPEDVPVIAQHFLQLMAGTAGEERELSPAAIDALIAHPWRGNARELRNLVERALILQPTGTLDAEHFSLSTRGPATRTSSAVLEDTDNLNLRERTELLERLLIQAALERAHGVKRDAADLLGIDPKNFGYYLRKHEVGEGGKSDARKR